jgi:hypothetical protein
MTDIGTHLEGASVHPEDKSQPSQGCKGQLRGYGDGPPHNNQISNMLLSTRSNDNKHIIDVALHEKQQQEWLIATRERGIAPRNNQPKFCRIAREQAKIMKAQSACDEIHCNAHNILGM